MTTYIQNARILYPGERIASGTVSFDNGQVAGIGNNIEATPEDTVIDAGGRLMTPGLIDLHVHGVMKYCFDNGADDLLAAAPCFARFGVTTVLPTVVPKGGADMLDRLAALAAALDRVRSVDMPYVASRSERPASSLGALKFSNLDVLKH